MTAFIPQFDPNAGARNAALDKARGIYRYNYTHVSPLAMLEKLPIHDEFSFGWITRTAERVLIGLANIAGIEIGKIHRDYHLAQHSFLSSLLETAMDEMASLRRVVGQALRFDGRIGASPRRPEALEDYANLFHAIGLPPIAKDFAQDEVFAAMRVAGPNPLMIQRMTAPDERFPVTDNELHTVLPDDSLDAAMAEGRLYLADYAALDGVECGLFPHGQKYLYAPLAMFVVERGTRRFLPVAIQCTQKPGPQNPIFHCRDGWNWMLAKTIVEIADANIHEAVSHLGRTHLLMEPFIISTHRQLAENHPLFALLTPHFQGTLAINEAAWKQLIADKGGVDKLMGGTIQESRRLAATSVTQAIFDDLPLPRQFAARGVDDPQCLPDYAYRDDAMLYWKAIRNWVDGYTAVYYPEAADLAGDPELQGWYTELRSENGGRIHGLGQSPVLGDRTHLADILTTILFTSSVQHAAVNFPQYDLMSYTPNMPCAGYAPAPTSKQAATEADFLNMLPPLDMAELQMNLGFLLGGVKYTTLGDYGESHFDDQRVMPALHLFQNTLNDIGGVIDLRNQERRPYEFLHPSSVPQSINI